MFIIPFYQLNPSEQLELARSNYASSRNKWETDIWKFLVQWILKSHKEFEIKTSGSTGTPKQILHKKTAMLHSIGLTKTALELMPNDNALLCLPPDRIGGMMMIARAQTIGMNLICLEPKLNPLLTNKLDVDIDFAAFTPSQFQAIISHNSSASQLKRIQKVILGGEPIQLPLREKIKTAHPVVYETFGMTETISHIALKKLNGTNPQQYFTLLEGVTGQKDNRGCLVVKAPSLCEREIATNDIVEFIAPERFEWLGRYDNIINSGGVKINPERIEEELVSQIPFSFLIGSVNDETLGQKLILIVEAEQLDIKQVVPIINAIQTLHKHYRPKAIYKCSSFVKTENGKIDRKRTVASAKLLVKV